MGTAGFNAPVSFCVLARARTWSSEHPGGVFDDLSLNEGNEPLVMGMVECSHGGRDKGIPFADNSSYKPNNDGVASSRGGSLSTEQCDVDNFPKPVG